MQKFLLRTFLALALLLALAISLLQFPAVQNYLVNKLTNFLSKELNTTVSLDRIDIDFFDQLVLENFLVLDREADTLLYSEYLKADIRSFALLRNRIELEGLYLNGAKIDVRKDEFDGEFNHQFIIDHFAKDSIPEPDPNHPKRSKTWFLELDVLQFKDLDFHLFNGGNGDDWDVDLPIGTINFRSIDLENSTIAASNVNLNKLDIYFTKYQVDGIPSVIELVGEPEEIDSTKKPLRFEVDVLRLDNGEFNMDNLRFEEQIHNGIDFNRLALSAIELEIDSFAFQEMEFIGDIKHIALEEDCGFVLNHLEGEALVNPTKVDLLNFQLRTPSSEIQDTLYFTYPEFPAFENFSKRVRMDLRIDDSEIAIQDIMYFAPVLEKNEFFRERRNDFINLSGKFTGRVNKLKGRNLLAKIGENTFLQGEFDSRDITIPADSRWQIDVERLSSSMRDLEQILPSSVRIPNNFKKLGNVEVKGSFIGFYTSFVADGNLQSDLGNVKMDMQLDISEGVALGFYDGSLEVNNFDLRSFTGNKDLGIASFKTDVKGTGVTGQTINAELDGSVDRFVFKDYAYENVDLDGLFNKRLFTGKLAAKDDNIDLNFNGTINFNDSLPIFNLAAKINYLDLQALNLVSDSVQLKSIVALDFRGNNIDNFEGTASLFDFEMINEGKAFALDSVRMNSYIDTLLGVREINLDSDFLSARMYGYFNILEIKDAALRFFEKHYPKYADKLNLEYDRFMLDTLVTDFGTEIREIPRILDRQDFTLSITGKKNSRLPDLFFSPITAISEFKATAYLDNENDRFSFGARVPQITFGPVDTRDLWVAVNTSQDFTDLQAGTSETVINDSIYLPALDYEGLLTNDTLNFKLNATDLTDFITNLNLVGQLFPTDEYFQLSIKPSKFLIYDKEWNVLGDNYVRFNSEYILTKNFKITHGSETIALNSIGKKGLDLTIGRLSLAPLNQLIGNPKLQLGGLLSADIGLEDIFNKQDFRVNGVVDSVRINEQEWGQLLIHAETSTLKNPIRARIKLKQGGGEIFLDGIYISPLAAKVTAKDDKNYFDFRVTANEFPVGFAEYFIPEISQTEGAFDADLRVFGLPERPNVQGLVTIPELRTKVDYLQTQYVLQNFRSQVNNNIFNFTGNKIQDINGRTATVSGGITHDHLRDFKLAVQVQTDANSPDFLLMNTKKKDNPDFYGTAYGSAFLDFEGPFNQIDLILSATNTANTKIVIPLNSTGSTQEVSFIEFVQRDTSNTDTGVNPGTVKFRGINLDMDLNVNPDAEIWIVFDEQAGDIIKGNGAGNIKILMTRTGEFSIYGGYTIKTGEYLFTYQNFINKPFAVKRDGTIRWDGDPYDAIVNLDAIYLGINVPPYSFIEEYLVGQETSQTVAAARTPTEVQLTMHLEGALLKPDITFDMEFPNLDPSLRAFVESKLQSIRQDDNALNRQVFGLIVLGNFLPSGEGPQSAAQLVTGINTLSELLSNQLSIYLTDLLSEVVNDVGFISSIDFDINYRLYQIENTAGGIDDNNLNTTASQVQLGLKNYFLDDRLIVNIGGNFDFANNSAFVSDAGRGAYIAGDFVIEYLITRDGRFRIRGYNRTESGFENIEGSQRNRTGVGISYSTQFDNFGEFMNSFFGRFKKKNKKLNNTSSSQTEPEN